MSKLESQSHDATAARPHRVLSGIQPSGTLHLGNYFGAIQQHIRLQDEFAGECFYFIADYHALTTVKDAKALQDYVRQIAVAYLALGLDPDKALLFRQSNVPEVTELTWLLATVTGMGLLERGHSYKDKVSQGIKPSVGLFTYPVLMASDILIYHSTLVPVGKDQVQHVEMTQDIATYFNETYGTGTTLLNRPEYRLSKTPYVPGLDGRKMSKSYRNIIPLFESGKKLKKLVGRIVTDSTPLGQPLDPEHCNVFALLKLFCETDELEEIRTWYLAGSRDGQDFGYGHAKQHLSAKIDAHFAQARAKRNDLLEHPEFVDQVLAHSASRARAVARQTLCACRQACGLG